MPAFYIVLQEQIPGVNANGLEGRTLSKYSDTLTVLAQQAGVTPLVNFFSADPDELAGFLEGHAAGVTIPEESWFPAEDGLRTIAALLGALASTPLPLNVALMAELKEFEKVLEAARANKVDWHLAVDY